MVPLLKTSSISPKEKYFRYLPYHITSLPEDEQTSKHGGGGRYNAILEFKGRKLKKIDEKENKKIIKRKKERKRNKEEKVYV
jgi:hypothetical protein